MTHCKSVDMFDTDKRHISKRILLSFALTAVMGLLAWWVSPYDGTLSHLLRLSGRDTVPLLLWQAAQPVKLFGKGDVLILLGLVLAIHRRKQVAISALIAVLLAGLIVAPTKGLVERQRPSGRDARAFPSGDAAAVAAFSVPVVSACPAMIPVALAGMAAIGTARVATGFHFPSDILAGFAIGILSGALVLLAKISLRARTRRFLKRSWLAAALGIYILIRLAMASGSDMRQFLLIFGPALVLAAAAPFIRAGLRSRRHSGTSRTGGRRRALAFGLAAIILAGFLFVTTRSTLWDRDEPRYSEATLEMVHSGNYLYPTFRGALRPDKPILIYWLMSLPFRLFGPTELACRFFAPVAAALTCLLTYVMACRFLGAGAGVLAMIILSTTPLLLLTGTAATTDAVLLATITGAMVIFQDALRKRPTLIHGAGMGLFLGAALLTKGPVGWVLPIAAMMAILLLGRRFTLSWAGLLSAASLLGAGLFLVWAIPANDATGGEYARLGIGYNVVGHTVQAMEGHGGQGAKFLLFLPFYIPVVIFAFFPWTLFLPGAISAVAGRRVGGSEGRAFLLGWMIPMFVLMSLIGTKLPHYILPIWPAMALAVAGTIEAAERNALSPRDVRWFGYGRWGFAGIGVIGGAVLVLGPWFIPPIALGLPAAEPFTPGLAWPIAGLGAILITMTLLASREHRAGRYRSTVGILAAGIVCVLVTISMIGLPMIEKFKLSRPLADAIRAQTAPDVEVYYLDFDEPSFIFYLGRRHLKPIGGDPGVITWAKQPGPGVLVLSREALAGVEAGHGPLGLKEIAAVRGFNYSKGRWATVVAVGRNLP